MSLHGTLLSCSPLLFGGRFGRSLSRGPSSARNLQSQYILGNIVAGGAVTAAFGMGSTSFTIKDADLNGVILTLPEATLPKLTEPATR